MKNHVFSIEFSKEFPSELRAMERSIPPLSPLHLSLLKDRVSFNRCTYCTNEQVCRVKARNVKTSIAGPTIPAIPLRSTSVLAFVVFVKSPLSVMPRPLANGASVSVISSFFFLLFSRLLLWRPCLKSSAFSSAPDEPQLNKRIVLARFEVQLAKFIVNL